MPIERSSNNVLSAMGVNQTTSRDAGMSSDPSSDSATTRQAEKRGSNAGSTKVNRDGRHTSDDKARETKRQKTTTTTDPASASKKGPPPSRLSAATQSNAASGAKTARAPTKNGPSRPTPTRVEKDHPVGDSAEGGSTPQPTCSPCAASLSPPPTPCCNVEELGAEACRRGGHDASAAGKTKHRTPGGGVGGGGIVRKRDRVRGRLMLLLHCTLCTSPPSRCAVTPFCAAGKALLAHIPLCTEECQVRHCASSKFLLHHFSSCTMAKCSICFVLRKKLVETKDVVGSFCVPGGSRRRTHGGEKKRTHLAAHVHVGVSEDRPFCTTAMESAAAGKKGGGGAVNTGNKAKVAKCKKEKAGSSPSPKQRSTAVSSTECLACPPETGIFPTSFEINEPGGAASLSLSYALARKNIPTTFLHLSEHRNSLRPSAGLDWMSCLQVRELLEPIVAELLKHPRGCVFGQPVDAVNLRLVDYHKIIRYPTDLGSILKRLRATPCRYRSIRDVVDDIRRCFGNAIRYNPKGHPVHTGAHELSSDFELLLADLTSKLQLSEKAALECEDNCALCGKQEIELATEVFWCNGCGERISRFTYFYTKCIRGKQPLHWCTRCVNSSKATTPSSSSSMGDRVAAVEDKVSGLMYKTSELSKHRHSDTHPEPWIECDSCGRWVHQICALFNNTALEKLQKDSSLKDGDVQYVCPICKVDNMCKQIHSDRFSSPSPRELSLDQSKVQAESTSMAPRNLSIPLSQSLIESSFLLRANQLRKTEFGSKVEKQVRDTLEAALLKEFSTMEALEKDWPDHVRFESDVDEVPAFMPTGQSRGADPASDKTSFGQESELRKRCARVIAGITVREVVCKWKESPVNKDLVEYCRNLSKTHPQYGHQHDNYPKMVKHFTRCISLFQRIDGVDVLQFVLYVHEYPHTCAAPPNKGRVYVSYLDSVKYFEPKNLRTSVFQEMMHAYFKNVQESGLFDTIHLWSCPPKRSDDYILYCHPESQRNPGHEQLRKWYLSIFRHAQENGSVVPGKEGITDLVDAFLGGGLKSKKVAARLKTTEQHGQDKPSSSSAALAHKSDINAVGQTNDEKASDTLSTSASSSARRTCQGSKTTNAEQGATTTAAAAEAVPQLFSIANLPFFEGDFGRDMWVLEVSSILRQRKKDGTLDALMGRNLDKKEVSSTPRPCAVPRSQGSARKRKMGSAESQQDIPTDKKWKAAKTTKSHARTLQEKKDGSAKHKQLSVETRAKSGDMLETPRGKNNDVSAITPRTSARTTRASLSVDVHKQIESVPRTEFESQTRKRRSPRNVVETCSSPLAPETETIQKREDGEKSEVRSEGEATSLDANGDAVFATPTRMMEEIMTKVEAVDTEGGWCFSIP